MPDVTMPNYGLLSGLAEGVKQGMITYQTMKGIQHQNQMQELAAGVQKNPDTGNLEYTPAKQAMIQRQADEVNPNSDISQSMAYSRGILANAGNPNIPKDIFSGKSAADQKDLEGLAKPDISGNYGLMGKQTLANLMGQRVQQGNARIQMSANNQYSQQMKNSENQLLSANRVNSLIQGIHAGNLQSTPQLKSDLSAALAQMLNAGKPATVYGMSHQEFDSAYGRAQKMYQFLSGTTGDSMTEPQLQQLQKDVLALEHEYQKQREVQYNSFKQGMPGQVVQGLDNRYQTFTQGATPSAPTPQQNNSHPQDSAALEWARKNPKDPRAAQIFQKNGVSQ